MQTTQHYLILELHAQQLSHLQAALINLSEWCKANGMVINTSKTKLMLITTPQKRAIMNTDNLFLNLNNLNTIKNDKILGVFVDNNLSWSSHVDKICKKITSNLWLLSRIKE